jgi:protein-L-isoaspartate(D-aspartate) O-methyltransferase
LYHRGYYGLNDSGAHEGRVGPHCRPEVVDLNSAKRRLLTGIRAEVSDEPLISAIERVPREMFVPAESIHLAYEDTPLPIGQGQTISQPLIVVLMIDALELRRTDRVLELGTGSGYQAALISELADTVISVERVGSLANDARVRLQNGGFHAVEVVEATEEVGWQQGAPYDAIIVAAGAPRLPMELIGQLVPGGRLVVPVGSRENQELMKVTRTDDSYSVWTMGGCRFVPLIGKGAWPDLVAALVIK